MRWGIVVGFVVLASSSFAGVSPFLIYQYDSSGNLVAQTEIYPIGAPPVAGAGSLSFSSGSLSIDVDMSTSGEHAMTLTRGGTDVISTWWDFTGCTPRMPLGDGAVEFVSPGQAEVRWSLIALATMVAVLVGVACFVVFRDSYWRRDVGF
jgi:hypothetical protein